MKEIGRREALALLGTIPIASALVWTAREAVEAQRAVRAGKAPSFFTDHEYDTVRVLVDWILPRDERSGSATDASVPEFMDFMMIDQPERQIAMRGGLAWIDFECQRRFDHTFLHCGDDERKALLDDIAWPERARPELEHGVEFFNRFRDLTATGFFTSRMGFEDLAYLGNEVVTEWSGCPREALRKLGLEERA